MRQQASLPLSHGIPTLSRVKNQDQLAVCALWRNRSDNDDGESGSSRNEPKHKFSALFNSLSEWRKSFQIM